MWDKKMGFVSVFIFKDSINKNTNSDTQIDENYIAKT